MIERRLPSGTYEISWSLPTSSGKTYRAPGEVHLSPHQQPFGTVKGGAFADWLAEEHAGLLSYFHLPQLTGQLASGMLVHFRNVQLDAVLDSSRLHPTVALVGSSDLDKSQDSIDSVLVQVAGLNDVFAFAVPDPELFDESNDVAVRVVADQDPASGTAREARAILLEFKSGMSLDDAISSYVESIRRIVSIGIGRSAEVSALSVGVTPVSYTGDPQWFDVFGAGIGQDVEWARPFRPGKKPALVFDEHEPGLLEMIQAWEYLDGLSHPLVDLFGASIYFRDAHPRSRFLIAMQTLEGAYAVDNHGSLLLAQDKYSMKRKSAIKEIKKSAASQLDFIEDALPTREPRALNDALRDYCATFLDRLEEPLMKVPSVAALVDSPRADDAIDGIRIIRNHLSHGEKSYPSVDLHNIARVLERAIRRKLLEKLGASQAAQDRAIDP